MIEIVTQKDNQINIFVSGRETPIIIDGKLYNYTANRVAVRVGNSNVIKNYNEMGEIVNVYEDSYRPTDNIIIV